MEVFTGYTLFFALLYTLQTSGQLVFTSEYRGKNVTGLVGSSVTFTWSYSGGSRGVDGVNWGLKQVSANDLISNGVLVSINAQSGNVVSVTVPAAYSGRVSGTRTGNQLSGQAIFTLASIKKDDERFYGCRLNPISDFDSNAFDLVYLVVQGPPDITSVTPNQTVNEGNKVTLNCTAGGNPTPTISWTKVSDGSVVTFPLTISKKDKGAYRCTAANGVGNPVSRDVFISVQYKPKGATIVISAPQNPVLQGRNVTFTCRVTDANPPVSEYKFYFNDTHETVQNVNHFTITNVQRSQHYGKYKCVAQNVVGEGQSDEVFLNINVPAKIISLTANVTVNKTNPIDLICDASGHPAPVIKWRKDEGGEQSTGSNHYRIGSSQSSDSGAYVCIAENVVGRAEMKTFVTVNYAATIKSATTSTAKSWIGKKVSLRCVAEGVPTPTITWKKPSGEEIKEVTTVHTADIVMKDDQDFGIYTCTATNGVGATATKTVKVLQIRAPDSPSITINIQATSIRVNWTAPANDGGSPVTAYRVVVLQGSTELRNENITNRMQKTIFIGDLTKSTNYTVKVFARNVVFEGNATERKIRTKFEGVPAAAEITDLPAETDKADITLKWKEAQKNGASITKYTVYRRTISEDGTAQEWVKIYVKDPSDREVVVTLQKGKVYEFVVTATNSFGEGGQEEEKIKKITVLGDVPSAVVFTYEIKDDEIILKWEEPDNNGAAITLYTVYKRIVNDEQWTKSGTIADVSKREYVVKVDKGKDYEFVVTATNKYGENPNKDNVKKVKVPGAGGAEPGTDATQSGGMNTPVIAGAAAAGVLLIASLIIFVVWWKRRKTLRDDASSSGTALRNGNEVEDGYQDINPVAAAQGLQASGPVVEPNYAQVDVSQKKKNRRPVTDEYAQVDKSKKTKKKPKKQPGELDYAELDDFRPGIQPAPAPSGANAFPLVRPPAYEGTVYADIGQFGVPQPEPTYGNVPKKDVVYSNVESM